MEIRVPFGKGTVTCRVSDERKVYVLHTKEAAPQQPMQSGKAKSEIDVIKDALMNPIGSIPLSELARGKKKVVVITSDHTRPVPSSLTLPLMAAEIRKGAPDADITFLIAPGTHRATTQEEMLAKFGADFVKKEKIVVHDPRDKANLIDLGVMPSGGRCIINKMAATADLLCADGFIEPHPMAGFSGGRKSVLPGIASMETVLACHCSEFTLHPNARPGCIDGNPINDDMFFAGRAAKLAFILNVVLDKDKKVIGAFAGDLEKAWRKGCAFLAEHAGVKAVKTPIVISSNGGYPLDQNMYQSNKCIQQADLVCADGGVIIAVDECSDGHGGQIFYDTFTGRTPRAVADEINARTKKQTQPDQWASQYLANILVKHPVIYVTKAPKAMIENFSMKWAPSLVDALAMAEEIVKDKNAAITVMPASLNVLVEVR
jgi:nickel-dependent lactate racemase